MHSRDFDTQRKSSPLKKLLSNRGSLQVVLGAFAIAAIVLAFRPGQSESQPAPSTPAPRPTVVATVGVVARATPVVATPTATAQERTHTVAAGDTLTSIAQKYYSDASKWNKIFEANKDTLPSANALQLGQKLKIPD
jgi:nucleoid-associated protein YgaU